MQYIESAEPLLCVCSSDGDVPAGFANKSDKARIVVARRRRRPVRHIAESSVSSRYCFVGRTSGRTDGLLQWDTLLNDSNGTRKHEKYDGGKIATTMVSMAFLLDRVGRGG